jgi:putative PIN family toxin of toxin-antitoxin system
LRVLVDTNVVLSAILFPKGAAAKAFVNIVENHHLVLSDYTFSELYDVFERKFRNRIPALDFFIDALTYEAISPPETIDPNEYPDLRDPDDLPILTSAVKAECDYLVSGDKDLLVLTSAPLCIVSPAEFIELTRSD